MKVKALSRSISSYQAPGSNVSRQPRNLDPALHPFERAREYTRALNATKLDRMFASPFVCQLGRGHVDGVYSIAGDPNSLSHVASGSGDGVVKIWNLESKEEVFAVKAHENIVKDTVWTHDRKLLTCAADKTIKLFDPYTASPKDPPRAVYLGNTAYTSLTHHRSLPLFAASSSGQISIYDLNRTSTTPEQAISTTTSDTITCLRFNPVETSLLAAASIDRRLTMYDIRTSSALPAAVLSFASNAISWNPMEAFNIAAASEDHNIYILDTRNLSRSLNILKDHVAAVMDVSFSPTGEELVSASYDRTIRLWRRSEGHSRDIYHTKRMQRVFRSTFTPDSKYVLSGSDDGNIRLWRAQANSRSGIKSFAQRQKLEYDAALVERYKHMPEIKRITRHRHIPKTVKKSGEIKNEELKAIKRRRENERKHSRLKEKPRRPEREKVILAVEQ